jgi:hypothetical protein
LGETLEKLGIPELTGEQIEELCAVAEATARKYVYSRVAKKSVEKLDVSAEAKGARPVSLIVEVNVDLSFSMKNYDVKDLAEAAVKEALKSAEEYLRKLTCP